MLYISAFNRWGIDLTCRHWLVVPISPVRRRFLMWIPTKGCDSGTSLAVPASAAPHPVKLYRIFAYTSIMKFTMRYLIDDFYRTATARRTRSKRKQGASFLNFGIISPPELKPLRPPVVDAYRSHRNFSSVPATFYLFHSAREDPPALATIAKSAVEIQDFHKTHFLIQSSSASTI
jgi:hypothetical protein